MARKRRLNRRQWLRPNNSWGPDTSIRTSLEVGTNKYDKASSSQAHIDGELVLRDCTHSISLCLWADKRKHAVAHLRMLDKLAAEVVLLRNEWAAAMEDIDQSSTLEWK